ncbi:hypothetical protein P4050_16560 [Pseudomonas aeruginosa]|nr:hypothetical protein [Pseudomonas aeruginosa]
MGDSLLELVSGVGQLLLYLQQLLLGLGGARDLLLVLDQTVLKGLGAFVGVLQLQVEQRSRPSARPVAYPRGRSLRSRESLRLRCTPRSARSRTSWSAGD